MTACDDCGETFESDDAFEQHKQEEHDSRTPSRAFAAKTVRRHVVAGGVLVLLLAAGMLFGIPGITGNTATDAPAAEDRPGTSYDIQGRQHVQPGQSHPAYSSNPPTSGWHYQQAADWGFYERELADELVVHNLEHGGIWISYTDAVNQTEIDRLRGIAQQYPRSVIVTQRNGNDVPIAVASWGQLMELQRFDRERIVAFIDANMNNSPEPFAGR
jgi:hypothetical protein